MPALKVEHECTEYDGLLIKPDSPEMENCKCARAPHEVIAQLIKEAEQVMSDVTCFKLWPMMYEIKNSLKYYRAIEEMAMGDYRASCDCQPCRNKRKLRRESGIIG